MPERDERLSAEFHAWERRGRGWHVFPCSVAPEPPFRSFSGHYLPERAPLDDGRTPTFLSSLVAKLSQKLSGQIPDTPAASGPEEEPQPAAFTREPLVELSVSLPVDFDIPRELCEQFLSSLALCREPLAFELLGSSNLVKVQFAASTVDAPLVRRQLAAHFPSGSFQSQEGRLPQAIEACNQESVLVFELGLAREFMLPLSSGKIDPFIGLVGAISELGAGELGIFQVIFQPARQPWSESILASVTHRDGSPFFINAPELVEAAKDKISRPLYAAVVRMLVAGTNSERTVQIASDMASSLSVFSAPQGNELIPLQNLEYPFGDHLEDVMCRQSRRPGMLLNSEELVGLVHLPSSDVRSPVLERQTRKSKAAPAMLLRDTGALLGSNIHNGKSSPVRLTADQRVQHMHVIGVQGTGKSTLLLHLIRQDIENGEGVGVLDPHGDLIGQILDIIPAKRIQDVVLVDPSDEEYSVGFNVLHAHSDLEKTLLSSDLVSIFERLSASWGDQMGSVLKNAILAFLESREGGTLQDLRRFLLEPQFRERFLDTVSDPGIAYYWRKGFTQLSGNKSIGPVITRLNDFLSPKPIRYMVSQKTSRLDFGAILDTGKIFLAKLPHGQMGKENSFLLGSLFVAKIQQLVMARQTQEMSVRKDFYLYIDEFHNFITPSMAEILTGARKYRLGLILAHQELRQLERDREVASAVLANPYTRVIFRVGDSDARVLAQGLSFFEAQDLQNLERGQAVARVEKAGFDFNLELPHPAVIHSEAASATRQAVVEASRERYAVARAQLQQTERVMLSAHSNTIVAPSEQQNNLPQEPHVPIPRLERVPDRPPSSPAAKGTETKSVPVVPPAKDLGRGGSQHRTIQRRVKEAAERLGFRSTIEKEILDGRGSVDVLLERDDRVIACEIAITTTIDHEVGNISKCLKAGFPAVAVICLTKDRREKLQAAALGSLGTEATRQIRFYEPDEFIAFLETLTTPPVPEAPQPKIRRGYKIKHSAPSHSMEERIQKEADAIRSITSAMQASIQRKTA